jgi:hypothetical protein
MHLPPLRQIPSLPLANHQYTFPNPSCDLYGFVSIANAGNAGQALYNWRSSLLKSILSTGRQVHLDLPQHAIAIFALSKAASERPLSTIARPDSQEKMGDYSHP